MNTIDPKLIEVFDSNKDTTRKYIKKHGSLSPMIITIFDDYTSEVALLGFKNSHEKEIMKNLMKYKLIHSKIKGYIFISDATMTSINRETKETEVKDAVFHSLYTPQAELHWFLIHEGNKIISEEDIPKGTEMKSEWGLWSKGCDDSEINEWYKKFKKDNPDKFKEIA